MKIILASESVFRRRALDILGLTYQVMPSNIDEKAIRHENARHMARRIATAKAHKISQGHPSALVVAADVFCVFRRKIYEKPRTVAEAKRMLRTFSGKEQAIITGIAVYDPKRKRIRSKAGVTYVKFRILHKDEIDDYVRRYPVTKLAGAYEADGLIRFASHVRGDYPPLVGFTMPQLIALLRQAGLRI